MRPPHGLAGRSPQRSSRRTASAPSIVSAATRRHAPRRPPRRARAVRLLTVLGLLASSSAFAALAPSTALAQTTAVTTTTTVSVAPQPDHLRLGWIPPADGSSPELDFPFRDNDEIIFERCALRNRAEECVVLSATCGTVLDDMETLFEIVDDLSVKLQASWQAQDDAAADNLPSDYRELPAVDEYGAIGMSHFLQAAWPLLPLEYMFLNWDMAFAEARFVSDAQALATAFGARLDADFAAIRRDHVATAWNARAKRSARNQVPAASASPEASTEVARWITGHDADLAEFPVFTLGALLNPATLAVAGPPNASTDLGRALGRLTGGDPYATWRGNLLQTADLPDVATALGHRISAEDRERLTAGGNAGEAVRDGLGARFAAADRLATKLGNNPRSKELPYQVRAVLAYLKLIIESPHGREGGFGGADDRSYAGIHHMPFHVFYEAPELIAGLLALFGRERPEYRSVRDVRFGGVGPDTFYEQRAESLLHDMFDYCATQLVLHDEQYVRWDDPFAGGAATTGRYARFELARQDDLRSRTGDAGVSLARAPAAPPTGSMLKLQARGSELGETRLWYCYSFGFGGCTETWTPVTVLVEPAGWDDARVVPQRDHFHVVVDWHPHRASGGAPARPGGTVMVFRPSPTGTVTLTDSASPNAAGMPGAEFGISAGRWIHDAHTRPFMPPTRGADGRDGWKYELVGEYCCLVKPDFDWSVDVELPVMDNDEVHFYDLPDPAREPAAGNELTLLAGAATCDVSRYCRHVRAHELPGRRGRPGPDIDLDAESAPSGIIATISARRDRQGRTADLFAPDKPGDPRKERAFERFWLSYCVSPQHIGCRNWTDRKRDHVAAPTPVGWPRQGHCVMATSLEPPVAPNAPSLLTLREWARQTGRPEGEYYFQRAIRVTVNRVEGLTWRAPTNAEQLKAGWGSDVDGTPNRVTRVERGHWTMRNHACPAVDPQNPRLADDWKRPDPRPGVPESCSDEGRTYRDDPQTLEYLAYRRFWRCRSSGNTAIDGGFNTAIVGEFNVDLNRAAHPTEFNVFVTVEFINPGSDLGAAYHNQIGQSLAQSDAVEAAGSTNPRPGAPRPTGSPGAVGWEGTKWSADPAEPADRGIPDEWYFPPVPCWNAEGEPTWQNLSGLTGSTDPTRDQQAALIDRAGCPHHGPTSVQLPLGGRTALKDCEDSFQAVLGDSPCDGAPAANFALAQGCVFPSFRVIVAPDQTVPNTGGPPPGHGVLQSGHYRWGRADYGGSFRPDGSFESSTSSGRDQDLEGAVDPGMALFAVSTGVRIDPSWQFCQNSEMTVVGVWPVHPGRDPGEWPVGACDGRRPDDDRTPPEPPDTNPVYEIDWVCESSFPHLYDADGDPETGIQLPGHWAARFDEMADDGVGCVGEFECEQWVIPEPGFYRVRILVDGEPVAKEGEALRIAGLSDPDFRAFIAKFPGATADQRAELQDTHFPDPPPFVFDKIIWAQSLHTAWS